MSMMHGCCVDRRWREQNPDVQGGPKGCTTETCMELPEGATCGDCAHWAKCRKFFGGGSRTAESTSCDWFPRKFLADRNDHSPRGTGVPK